MLDHVPVLACLSDYSEALVHELAGTDQLVVRVASGSGDDGELADLVDDADLVIGDAARRYVLDAAAIDAMRRCRFIQQPAVGYDSVDVARAAERGIAVANAPGYNAEAVADWVVMATLVVLRGGVTGDALMRRGEWAALPLGRDLGALTVGLLGMGAVAQAVTRRLRGFGSTVVYTARTARDASSARRVDLPELLTVSDVVSLHLPLTPSTRHVLGPAELAAMKQGAVLVNAARGALVDQEALAAGLRNGHPAAAALDVFTPEPLPADSPLRALENVFLTPHLAGSTWQSRVRVRELVSANLHRVLAGQPPLHVINPPIDAP